MSIFSAEALLRKKPPGSDEAGKKLSKVLSALDLTLLGIGAIIGTGIFVLTGVAAATQSGPAVVISFIFSGLACAFAALSYAELAASIGGCGSAYGYSYAAFGELVAWIIGWDLILEYGVSVAAVANGWSGHLKGFFAALGLDFPLPDALTRGPFATTADGLPDPGIMNLPAMLIILCLMVLLVAGVRQSARLNAAMVFIKLMTIAVFIGVAVFHVQPELWHPFMPFGWFATDPATGKTMGILAGASVVFFAYVGFDAVSTAVEEARDPKRDVPIGILASLIICTVLYIVVSGLLTGIVKYTTLNNSDPVAYALQEIGISWASGLVACGVVTGLTTVMLVLYYGLTRIIFAMSNDGLLPASLGTVNEKTHTPAKTTIICGIVMAIMAGVIPLGTLAELVNVGTLAAFVLVCAGVIALRITKPEMERPFKTPGGLIVPILGVLSCGALIAFLPLLTHLRFVAWLAVGMVIYFAYSARHSRLRKAG
jgi:APA family basic amino acid/polyamine antiporter